MATVVSVRLVREALHYVGGRLRVNVNVCKLLSLFFLSLAIRCLDALVASPAALLHSLVNVPHQICRGQSKDRAPDRF